LSKYISIKYKDNRDGKDFKVGLGSEERDLIVMEKST
jgi:hypothetical protein